MLRQRSKEAGVAVICVLTLISFGSPKALAVPPPEPELQEWETSPDIFALYPKTGLEEVFEKPLKSPPVSTIHKYLPGTTRPIDYRIKISMILESEIDEEELKAPGSVQILIKCVEPTKEIVMHANTKYVTIIEDSVKVSEALLGKPINRVIPVVNQTYEIDNDFYTIHLASACKLNKEYVVDIRFVAEIATDTLSGLYLSTYLDRLTNTTKRLATTQFEAEYARQMFPNYDDPDYKATFQVIVGRQSNYNSLSNMNLIKTEINKERPGWYWDFYDRTPVMSSYLLAIVVSEFTCVPAPPPGYKKYVEVCGPPHMIAKGGGLHSAEVVATVLAFYDNFMKQEYPLPKMTSVAIPDFQAGAMENWGLNTYRIKGLIYYPSITSEDSRYRIDLTIAHELAHQNWGNLVTTKLWNQIWLNEGFATYISYFGIKSISPEYEPDKQWMTGYRKRALQIDGNIDTHPLVNISSPMFYFDGISYSKGASILKMLENFLTPKVFHEALRAYLARHAYSTTTQWDLFKILESHALSHGVLPSVASFTEIMESWTLQPGYPLIRVKYVSDRAVLVSQERYVDTPDKGSITIPPPNWYTPITILHDKIQTTIFDKKVPTIWLSGMEPSKIIYLEDDARWIIINPDASVLARIIYDDRTGKLIENQLNTAHETISAITRSQIIEDAFEVAWAGYGPVEAALNYTRYLGKELEPIVWSSALNGLGRIYSMFADDELVISQFKEYVYERISSSLLAMGVAQGDDEKGASVLHRGSMLHWAGLLEIPEALQHATESVQYWTQTSINKVPADLHSQTYCNAVIGGDKSTYENLLNLLHQEKEFDVKLALVKSLGCSKDETILNELRLNLTNEEFVSPALGYELMLKLSRNGLTRKNLLEFLDENFSAIQNRFDGVITIAKSLETAAQFWNTNEHLEKVQDFIAKYKDDLEDEEKIIKRVLKGIQNNISWMERFSDSVRKWLTNS